MNSSNGFPNVDPVSIKAIRGEKRERQAAVDLVKALNDRGIRFFASCAMGRDWDDSSISDRTLSLLGAADIHTAEFFVFTPYPGSVHWDRLERQGRLLDRPWSEFNGCHVVARPMQMSVEEFAGLLVGRGLRVAPIRERIATKGWRFVRRSAGFFLRRSRTVDRFEAQQSEWSGK